MNFVEKDGDAFRLRLEADEAMLLRALMEQMLALLGDSPQEQGDLAAVGIAEKATKSDDPVLARLFPDAYEDDGEAAGEFRRYTELGLRDGKREAAGTILGALGSAPGGVEVLLDEEQAQIWLRALNDVRLALGTRLEITEDWYEESARIDPSDPRGTLFAAYDWLTVLQESLVRVLW